MYVSVTRQDKTNGTIRVNGTNSEINATRLTTKKGAILLAVLGRLH